ncbi:helix-turn-helix domain-containing protein [Micromonospora costi]|uniref:AraC family transcriptional regulator n=1 Tax=Micromonospora costi TaxID=1530042 RepID=A0A3B0A4E1_9ACTN|nr:helix-turn-helix domain-containing protein [Micromonospora costi]RKN55608.1 AraC family transcriptional regulator [Micromonospora costi]
MTAGGPVDGVVLGLPSPRLRPYVARYVGYRERADLPLVRREVAGAFVVLILGWGAPLDVEDPRSGGPSAYGVDSFVAGTFDGWCRTRTVGVGEGVELLLAPLAARRIFGLPMDELANRAVDVTALPGGWLDRLRCRLAAAPGWPERFALLDAALAARLAGSEPVDPRVAWAWRRLTASGGLTSIGWLAGELGWSRRHLAVRFRREVGLSPKTTARLLRFQRAYAALTGPACSAPPIPDDDAPGGGTEAPGDGADAPAGGAGASGESAKPGGGAGQPGGGAGGALGGAGELADGWAQLAARCGYYDQSHLIRDFREFAGDTPAALLAARTAATAGR